MRGVDATGNACLTRKGISPHGMRQNAVGKLLVCLKDEQGWIRILQVIDPGGGKIFLPDGRTHGYFTLLSDREVSTRRPLVVAEGFAAAAALREMLGLPVAVAFTSGNLLPVLKTLQGRYPSVRQVLAADNDHHLPRRNPPLPNAGQGKIQETVGGLVLLREFAPH